MPLSWLSADFRVSSSRNFYSFRHFSFSPPCPFQEIPITPKDPCVEFTQFLLQPPSSSIMVQLVSTESSFKAPLTIQDLSESDSGYLVGATALVLVKNITSFALIWSPAKKFLGQLEFSQAYKLLLRLLIAQQKVKWTTQVGRNRPFLVHRVSWFSDCLHISGRTNW